MMETKYLYLLINVLVILPPLLLSFDRKVAFYQRWKQLWPAIIAMLIPFVLWDIWFTGRGIWGFNEAYLMGITLINLPIEEWLFFITIPYASIFVYDCVKIYFPAWIWRGRGRIIGLVLAFALLVIAALNVERLYTSITFASLATALIVLNRLKAPYLGRFFASYVIVLVPFFIVNGILTGSGLQEQVVWYNDAYNLGIRLWTIPIEDTFYGMLLILGGVAIYEGLNSRSSKSA